MSVVSRMLIEARRSRGMTSSRPAFTPEHHAEIHNLYHLAKGATASGSRYERMKYAAKHFSDKHPEFARIQAYKYLDSGTTY